MYDKIHYKLKKNKNKNKLKKQLKKKLYVCHNKLVGFQLSHLFLDYF